MNPALLGSRIRQARERIGMSQEELAVAVSKDQRSIYEYEKGKRKLAAVDLPTFAHALQVPVQYFYTGENIDDLTQVIVDEFQQLESLEAKQAAITIVRVLVDTLKANPR